MAEISCKYQAIAGSYEENLIRQLELEHEERRKKEKTKKNSVQFSSLFGLVSTVSTLGKTELIKRVPWDLLVHGLIRDQTRLSEKLRVVRGDW